MAGTQEGPCASRTQPASGGFQAPSHGSGFRLPLIRNLILLWAILGAVEYAITAPLCIFLWKTSPWRLLYTEYLGFYAMVILLTPLSVWLLSRVPAVAGRIGRSIAWSVFLMCPYLAIHLYLRFAWIDLFSSPKFPNTVTLRPENIPSIRYHLIGSFWLWIITVVAVNGWEYYLRFRERERAAAALEMERANLRASLSEARIEALQVQLQPHFLFNALHALSTLILKGENQIANDMLTHLSRFLRMTLNHADKPTVPLGVELDHLNAYLSIQRTRFTDRLLTVDIEVDEATRHIEVPNLIFQPLVENSIRHGIASQAGPGHIRVSAKLCGTDLILEVEDNGKGLPEGLDVLEGVGLGNIRQRLSQLYPGRHTFTLGPGSEGGTRVRITLPKGAQE